MSFSKPTSLDGFHVLVDGETFSAAAQRHNTTPTNQVLEEWLGVEPINQRANQFHLTETSFPIS